MKKRIVSVILMFMLSFETVYGEILGDKITGWSHKIAKGTDLYKNEFISSQEGVGKQTEIYAKYTPNSDVLPIVSGGLTVWGTRNIKKAEEYLGNYGTMPFVGINASFFSFQTGIPMGISVEEGRIITKDTEEYQAIGFNSDGSAFIAPVKVETLLRFGETELEISHINKYNQDTTPIINLYTNDFDDNNHNEVASLTIILNEIDGNLGIGDTVSATVCDKFNYQGAVKIPDGQFLITLNENSDEAVYGALNSLEIGDTVEINSSANDIKWDNADYIMGSVGDRLIENGEVKSGFEKGAAPRTAVGITKEGEVILYVLDGRQQGYSYGAKIETVAKRLKELGCVDAINLDGGGSTSFSGVYPGDSDSTIINSPSEGKLRGCTNYLFLKNNLEPTGEIGGIYMYPFEEHYLSGYSEQLTPKAVDSAFYPMQLPGKINISASGDSFYDNATNTLTAIGNGIVTVTANCDDVKTETYYHSYDTPTDIIVKNDNGKEISSLTLKRGDTVNLTFEALYNGIKLKANREQFYTQLSHDIGKLADGRLEITENSGEAVLTVSAGNLTREIPVKVESVYSFSDIQNHWACEQIQYVYNEGIVSGYDIEDGPSFLPQKNITREEFAVIICRMLGIETKNEAEYNKEFEDVDDISDWAKPYVFQMAERDIILGSQGADNKFIFSPKRSLTRAEAITILSRVLNVRDTSEISFDDDAEIPKWAKEAIYAMYKGGFITGYPDNTIKPTANVSRAEATVMIYNIISKSF